MLLKTLSIWIERKKVILLLSFCPLSSYGRCLRPGYPLIHLQALTTGLPTAVGTPIPNTKLPVTAGDATLRFFAGWICIKETQSIINTLLLAVAEIGLT